LPPVGLAVLPLFLVLFFELCFFLAVVSLLFLVVCEPLAGGLAGVWAANVRGIVATAKAMLARIVFFMVFFSPSRALPAYNSMMRQRSF
jgi:hypothetical protein